MYFAQPEGKAEYTVYPQGKGNNHREEYREEAYKGIE